VADMEIIKTVKDRSPILLGLVIALMVSVVLIIAGFKVKSQSLITSVLLWIIGVVGILICLYLILFSIFFGMNW
jgi:fatty-acid desaturase